MEILLKNIKEQNNCLKTNKPFKNTFKLWDLKKR